MGALCLLCSPYLSKLDAGSGCLTASVKLWCGCLILGSMHLTVFTIIILKKVEEAGWMEASGSAVHLWASRPLACWRWMECPGQGFKVPPISNHTFQRDGSAWWMIFIEEKELKEACHCSHSMVFVCATVAPTFIWQQMLQPTLSMEWFIKTGFLSAALVYWQYSATDGHLCAKVLVWRLKMPQLFPQHGYCLD